MDKIKRRRVYNRNIIDSFLLKIPSGFFGLKLARIAYAIMKGMV